MNIVYQAIYSRMRKLNILIAEGNLLEESQKFKNAEIETHTESLINSMSFYTNNINIDVVNPSTDLDLDNIFPKLKKYDGLIWGGSSLNIYNDSIEVRRQILFIKECFKSIKKILGICWGMQLAVTAAGGVVKRSSNGSQIGIANNISLNNAGLEHPMYKEKKNSFNSPAFNFDEVVTVPSGAIHLASNDINKIQSLYFNSGVSEIWGLQYHPEIMYEKMINIIKFRKDKLINQKDIFKNQKEVEQHIKLIENEIKVTDQYSRMLELKNWINSIN